MVYDSSISPSDSKHPSGNLAIDLQDSSILFFYNFPREDCMCETKVQSIVTINDIINIIT